LPGWVTVFERVNYLVAEPGTQVYSASYPSVGRRNEYLAKAGKVNKHIVWYSRSCSVNWLWTSLTEISADVREVVARQMRW